MVASHCEILWADNSGSGLGIHPTSNYGAGLDDPEKQAIISQQRLSSNMIGLCINNYLTTDSKLKLRSFRTTYIFKNKDDGSTMFFPL